MKLRQPRQGRCQPERAIEQKEDCLGKEQSAFWRAVFN